MYHLASQERLTKTFLTENIKLYSGENMLSKKMFLASILFFVLIDLPLISLVGASSEMWNQTYGGTSSDEAEAVVQTSDGGYALAGYTTSFGAGSYDFWLVKTDASGSMEWNQTYGGTGIEHTCALVGTSDGGYAIAGGTPIFIPESGIASDFWLVKTDTYGYMEWNQTYSGGRAYALVETLDGSFALAGGTRLVKTDAYGNMLWNRTYGGVAYALVETSNGGYALAGYAPIGAGTYDFWLAKTDEHGVIPEFPSWIILPLFVIATASTIVVRKRISIPAFAKIYNSLHKRY